MPNTKKYVSLDKLGLYDEKIKKYLGDADAAILAQAAEAAEALGDNYDPAGAAATAKSEAIAYADGKDAAIAEAKAAGDNAQSALDTYKGTNDKAVQDLQTAIDNLDAYVGDIPAEYAEQTNVIAYVNKKAEEVLSQATGGSSESAASVKAALDAYKALNDPKVTANAEAAANAQGAADDAQAAADAAQEYAEGVAANLTKEETARKEADEAQVARIATLEGQITGLTGAMHFKGVIETDPAEITEGYVNGDVVVYGEKEYVWNNDAFVEFGDVSAEGERIAALETHKTTYEAKVATLESEMDTAQADILLKADKTALDSAVEALEGADGELSGRIKTLEDKFGGAEGSVEDQIADAQAAAIAAAKEYADAQDDIDLAAAKKYADDEDAKIEATVATLTETVDTKAAQTDLTALEGRVATAEGEIDTLQSEMDAVEALAAANKAAHEANAKAIALKADQTALTAVSDRVGVLETWHQNFTEASEEEINALFPAKA